MDRGENEREQKKETQKKNSGSRLLTEYLALTLAFTAAMLF